MPKEDDMRKLFAVLCICLLLAVCLAFTSQAQAKGKTELIGKISVNWNLVSNDDKLINYGPEYYGKYYLIMTFFPAAYTPV